MTNPTAPSSAHYNGCPVRAYHSGKESRKFTTDFINTTASYEFAKKGDTIERTITMKKFVRGTWSMEKDGSFNVELE